MMLHGEEPGLEFDYLDKMTENTAPGAKQPLPLAIRESATASLHWLLIPPVLPYYYEGGRYVQREDRIMKGSENVRNIPFEGSAIKWRVSVRDL